MYYRPKLGKRVLFQRLVSLPLHADNSAVAFSEHHEEYPAPTDSLK